MPIQNQIIIMGVSGSGKSTIGKALAKRLNLDFFDGDEFHPKENIKKMAKGLKLEDQDRIPWLNSISNFLKERYNKNKSTILACSALKKEYREIIQDKTQVTFVYLKGNKETIEARLEERTDHFMPSSLLDSQFSDLEEPNNAISVSIEREVEIIINEIEKELERLK